MAKYENFIFYGSWREHLDGLKELCDRDLAKEVAWQIINYGTSKEFDTKDQKVINIVNGMCRDLIESAKSRRQASVSNGKQGGRPSRYDPNTIRQMHQDGMSPTEIADKLGCTKRTVQRALDTIVPDDDEI